MRATGISLALLGAELISVAATGFDRSEDNGIRQVVTEYPFAEITIDSEHPEYKRDAKVPLRILPFGASIVYGIGSTSGNAASGNGFRKPLRDALRFGGWEVDMVGTRHSGDMQDWESEATPGAIISQGRNYFKRSAAYKPNVIVINLGTNDANGNIDVKNAGGRMRLQLNDMWSSPEMDKTCIILSTLLPSGKTPGEANRLDINNQYRNLVKEFSSSKCIYLADMDPVDGPAHGWIRSDINPDGIHPNNEGHRKMAYVFWKAILKAASDGKITAPAAIDSSTPKAGCDKSYGDGVYVGAHTQLGSGIDDGIYYHDTQGMGVILNVTSAFDRNQWHFARLYGRKHDDFVGWFEKSPGVHAFGVWKNFGDGKFSKIADLDPDLFCMPEGIHFIDMNADGYDDLVCIDAKGNAYLSVNQRDGTNSKPPSFKRVSDTALIKKTEGYSQERIRLGDIDGDGRGDYCILDDGGNINCWRNGWVDDMPKYWQALGQRFKAKGKDTIQGVRFEDINGDGRDDWIFVDDTGAVETWTNARSCAPGKQGDGLNVAWRQGFHKGESSGNTHAGVHVKGVRKRILFGRVYGEPQDFGNLGRQDYVYLEHKNVSATEHVFSMHVFKNKGFGGTKLKADGNKYCNMVGHEDGREDYVWTLSTGQMRIYPNKGLKSLVPKQSFWGESEIIWDPKTLIGKDLDRRDLHLMDWDGDGTCDIVWVNPDNGNRPSVWLNHFSKTQKWSNAGTWQYYADPPSARDANVHCDEQRGVHIDDLSVRFGDIDGNGRDDYLCLGKDGRVTGYVHNKDNGWKYVGQVKFAEGKDRANLRWADVNGDGADDMIWVDKFTGDGLVYYNRGFGDPAKLGGSAVSWDKSAGAAYLGDHAGTCQYFPDLDGNGRADLHSILGTFNNEADSWLSPDCGLANRQGDDPGCCVDPRLPVKPGDGSGGSTDPPGSEPGDSNCNKGHGPGDWNNLCGFICRFGYCPDPCVCDSQGKPEIPIKPFKTTGFPATGKGLEFRKPCAFACSRDFCPSEACAHLIGSGILAPAPKGGDGPDWVDTHCEFAPYVHLINCNAKTFKLSGKYDPYEVDQDCTDPAKAKLPWQCACNACGVAGDRNADPQTRWNSVYAGTALSDMAAWYSISVDSGTLPSFIKGMPDAIATRFGGARVADGSCDYQSPSGFHCDLVGDEGCKPITCSDTQYAAVSLVLDSMYHVHNTHQKFWDAATPAMDTLKLKSASLAKTFVRQGDASLLSLLKKILMNFDAVFAVTGAGVWEKLLTAGVFEKFTKVTTEAMKVRGSINAAIGVYGQVAGEEMTAAQKQAADAQSIDDAIGVFGTTLRNSVSSYLKYIYSGELFANAALDTIFADGVWVYDPSASLSTQDVADLFSHAALVKLIQVAWGLEDTQYPAVLYDKAGVDNPLSSEQGHNAIFSDGDASKTRYPGDVDGGDSQKYSAWIVNVNNPPPTCSTRDCISNKRPFGVLAGMDTIKDDGNSWGITWKDMVTSSLQGFLLAGKKNPFGVADAARDATGDFGSDNFITLQRGVKAPGFVNIPTCTAKLALENYQHLQELRIKKGDKMQPSDVCAEWPCCKPTWEIVNGSPCKGLNELCE